MDPFWKNSGNPGLHTDPRICRTFSSDFAFSSFQHTSNRTAVNSCQLDLVLNPWTHKHIWTPTGVTFVTQPKLVVQMANPGMDAVHSAKFHVTDMLQWSCLLTAENTPPHTPHPASHPINYHVRVEGSQVRHDMAINQSFPDHNLISTDQLQTLVDHTGDKGPYTWWTHCEHIVSVTNVTPAGV